VHVNRDPLAGRRGRDGARQGARQSARKMIALPSESGGNSFVGVLRVVSAIAVGAYVITYVVTGDQVRPAHTTAIALALCVCLAASGIGQAVARIGASRRSAAVILALDLVVFLGLAALFSFDPRDDLFVLMFLFVIEAGLTLDGRGAALACGVAMLGYGAVGAVSGDQDGIPSDLPVTVLWYGLLVVVAGIAVLLTAEAAKRAKTGKAYRDSEEKLRTIVDHAPAAIYALDLTGVVLSWNPAAVSMFGWTETEVVGRRLPIVPPERLDTFARGLAAMGTGAGQQFVGVEMTGRHRDGTAIEISVSTAAILDPLGDIAGVIAITTDITDSKRIEAELEVHQRSDRQLASIVAASGDAIFSAGMDGKLTSWNPGAEALFGYQAAEVLGQPVSTFTRPQDQADEQRLAEMIFSGTAVVNVQAIRVRKDGTVFPAALTGAPLIGPEGGVVGMSAIVRNITVQKDLEASLERRVLNDELTGLPNRVLFVDRLSLALTRLPRRLGYLGVLFVDVDQFKVINDSLGHDEGDRLLVMIGERLTTAVRPGDTVARFGGDEFAILCEELVDEAEAVAIGERIRLAAAVPLSIGGEEYFVTVSTGIALADGPDAIPAELLRDAHSAMYQAKGAGRARSAVFAESMRTNAVRRLATEVALRRAIIEGELRVHYQPIVSLKTGRTEAVEALVRWEHPTEGMVFPDQFIAIAEETGLIVPLGEWVLGEACRQVHRWHTDYPELSHLMVSVNLSGRQIAQSDLVNVVANLLADTGLRASHLVLEITESVLMGDAEAAITVLRSLKSLGVGLSVDDFGTGYSSLSYLKKFPVDILKIDKSFVDGLGTEGEDSAIVRATVTLAHSLGLETVAEGTETPTQLLELRDLGCDKAQGYFFSRPQSAAAIIEVLLRPLVPVS
jgi:diguanylate cyclase (GGDEF)-like protein/PAS domain S-box-containing protein